MKKTILLVLLAAGVLGIPLFAQESSAAQGSSETLDFTKPTPQFLSFSIGVPIGFLFDPPAGTESMVSGTNFGLGFTPFDKLTIGYEYLRLSTGTSSGIPGSNHILRVGYSFTDMFGAAISVGTVVGLGGYVDLFQARSKLGIAHGLRLRLDYFAPPQDFGKGGIFFTLGAVFGL